VEAGGAGRRGASAGFGQRAPPLGAKEQRHAEALLEQFDLVADRSLGHSELGCRLGEALVARGGLEHPDGGQGRKRSHRRFL